MQTHKQYIVPTSGKPIRGLIQDSVVSGVYLTSKDCFLSKDDFQHLVYSGLRELVEMKKSKKNKVPSAFSDKAKAAIHRQTSDIDCAEEHRGGTGRLLEGRIYRVEPDSKSKLNSDDWGPIGKEEGEVIFRDSELLQGTLDKNQFGAVEYGLVHAVYEVYGSEKLANCSLPLQESLTNYLQSHGFTCGH